MSVNMYVVGGWVRDKILGLDSKDIDFAVEAPSYEAMKEEILRRGGHIYIEKPEYLTIRANFSKWGAADFVLCRRDGTYFDGRRPESVEPGTLIDDLKRRDFTMNAIAMTEDGEYIDPFNGRVDIEDKMIRCVGVAKERFEEDYLRMLRAIRFQVTKNMQLSPEIIRCLTRSDLVKQIKNVSIERVYEEMYKAFAHDTHKTMSLLMYYYPMVGKIIFDNTQLWLKPTLEIRSRSL